MGEQLKEITDADFEKLVLQAEVPVLVDIFTSWCQPCKILVPVLEKSAERFAGRIKFLKLNIEGNSAVGIRYRVQAVPTLILFQNGQEVARSTGLGTDTNNLLSKELDKYAKNS